MTRVPGGCDPYSVSRVQCCGERRRRREVSEHRSRSQRQPALTFTHDVSVTTEHRGPDTDSVGCEPVTREHGEYTRTQTGAGYAGPRSGLLLLNFCKAHRYQDNLHYIMWTFFLRGWFILSTSGEFSLLVLKDKYPVRTKCFVVSQPDNIC